MQNFIWIISSVLCLVITIQAGLSDRLLDFLHSLRILTLLNYHFVDSCGKSILPLRCISFSSSLCASLEPNNFSIKDFHFQVLTFIQMVMGLCLLWVLLTLILGGIRHDSSDGIQFDLKIVMLVIQCNIKSPLKNIYISYFKFTKQMNEQEKEEKEKKKGN